MDVRNTTAVLVQVDVPTLLIGSPGCGKSSYVLHDLAPALGCTSVKQHIGSIRPPEELIGIPMRGQAAGTYAYLIEESLHKILTDPRALLLIDEVTCLNPSQQAGMLALLSERRIGEVHAVCKLIGAANPPTQAAAGNELSPAFANRFAHLMFKLDPVVYTTGIRSGKWGFEVPILPEGWESGLPAYGEMIADFMGQFGEFAGYAENIPTEFPCAYPTARTWEMTKRFLAGAMAVSLDLDDVRMGVDGLVGEKAGATFMDMFQERLLPIDLTDLFKDPEKGIARVAGLSADQQKIVFSAVNDRIHRSKVSQERGAAVYVAAVDQIPQDIIYPHYRRIRTQFGALATEIDPLFEAEATTNPKTKTAKKS